MPQKSQNRPSPQQTPTMQSSYSNTVAGCLQSDDDDDDDICPTCIGKCTCNTRSPPTPSASVSHPQLSHPPTTSLKIRLTVPPSLLSSLHTQPRVSTQSSKPKMTTSASVRDGGSVSQDPSTTIRRKRGRPSKAETEARRAAAMEVPFSTVSSNRISASPNKIKASHKLKSKGQKLKTKPRSRPPAQTRFENDSDTSSDLDGEEVAPSHSFGSNIYLSDSEEAERDHHTGLDSDLSELSSLPDPGDESSLEVEEERYIIQEASPRNHDKSRVKRELLGDDNNRRFDRLNQGRQTWQVRTSRRSQSIDAGATTTDSDSDSQEEENDTTGQDGDEEDGDADEDAEMEDQTPTFLPPHRGIWSDVESTEEEFDADLFFASLSDSDTSTAEFEHVFQPPRDDEIEEEEANRMDAIQIDDTFGGGLLGSFSASSETTVLVSRDFNGQPVFTNGSDFAMGMLDLDFELNIVAQARAAVTEQSGTFPSTTSNGEDDEMWIASDTEDAGLDSEHGETTDDDISVLKGVQTASGVVMFRFPTPPISSINPLSTLSTMPKKSSKSSSAKRRKAFEKSQYRHLTLQTTKPTEQQSKNSRQSANGNEQVDDEAASDSGHSSLLSSSKRHPVMGRFDTQPGPSMHHIIINGGGKNIDIPSPVSPNALSRARVCARRDSGSSRGRMRGSIGNESPISMLQRRKCRSPVSSRSISTDTRTRSSYENAETASAFPPVTPIELDEVLDSSLIDPLSIENNGLVTDVRSDADSSSKYLDRWDRVPMGAFRQTRHTNSSSTVTNGLTSVMEWAPNQPAAVSDGFCYGSPGGSLMRSRTLPLFDPTGIEPSRRRPTLLQSHPASPTAQKRPASGGESGFEGDQTPTGQRTATNIAVAFGNTPEEEPMPKILSHKARRKAKRRLVSTGNH